MSPTTWLSRRLLGSTARRLGAGRSEWARAMAAELDACESPGGRARWAFGCWWASLRTPGAGLDVPYPLALAAGAGLMTAYEWSADEGPVTVALLMGLSLGLGALKPGRAVVSALMLGLVVSAVLVFEKLSGVRPAYETHPATFAQSLRWTVFLIPALLAAALGGEIGTRARRVRVR